MCRNFFGVLLFLLILGTASATTYYVKTTGNDTTGNGSSANPWRTIQTCASYTALAEGDTCLVSPGDYTGTATSSKVNIVKSGSAGKPITFKSSGAGVMTNGFIISGKSYIVIDGFDITTPLTSAWDSRNYGAGIYLSNAKNNELRNNHIQHTISPGIYLFDSGDTGNKILNNKIEYAGCYAGIVLENGPSNNTIEGNDISHTIQHPRYPTLCSLSGSDADGIKFDGSGNIFRGNYIHDITTADYGNVSPHVDGIQSCCYSGTSNILIEKNWINLTTAGTYTQGVYVDDASYTNINVVNNVIEVIQPINFVNVTTGTIYNNTLLPGNPSLTSANGIQLINSSGIKVKNNIIYERKSDTDHYYLYLENSSSGLDVGYNNYYRISGVTSGSYATDTSTDPKFLSPATTASILGSDGIPFTSDDGLVLQNSSPAINSGTNVSVTTDILGTSRPQGISYDLGAYEYLSIIPTPDCAIGNQITSACICNGSTYSSGYCCSAGYSSSACTILPPVPAILEIEAEECALSSGSTGITFSTQSAAEISYIYQVTETSNPLNGGKAVCNLNVSEAGEYVIQVNANAPNDGSNSIFINVDSDANSDQMVWDIPIAIGFQDSNANWRGQDGNFEYSQFIPKTFDLNADMHKVIIIGREGNTNINKIQLIKISKTISVCLDFTGDKQVNIFDLVYVATRILSPDLIADITADGVVDIFDLIAVSTNFKSC
ncbi:MAG: right-handed parallel beta-helix repeat-containing protein [archaeon]|nr:right-handed parallel beta-helix repeat-containing protein [archaeon]